MQVHAPWTDLLNKNEKFKERIIHTLVKRGDGMFQYVNFASPRP